MSWKSREERIRLDIIKDLVKLDLLTCRPISDHRQTAHITAVLPDAPTVPDHRYTRIDPNATTVRTEAV